MNDILYENSLIMQSRGVGTFSGYFDKTLEISTEYENSSLDYSKPMFSANFQSAVDQIFHPLIPPSQVNDRQSFRFDIGSFDDPHYTNIQSIRCHGKLKVLNSDNTDLAAGENVSCINLMPECLFEQINVTINNQVVSDHGRGTHIKSYLSKKYNFSEEVKDFNLKSSYYEEDVSVDGVGPHISVAADDKTKKTGFKTRMQFIKESNELTFCFIPSIDLFSSENYFPAGYILGLEFERTPANFLLLSSDASKSYRIQILDLYLEARRIIPSKMGVQRLGDPMKEKWISFRRSTVRRRQIHAGVSDVVLSRLLDSTASLPYSLMVIPIQNDQHITITKNPFVFLPHKIKSYNLLLNGASKPMQPLKISTTDKFQSLRAYDSFMSNLSILNANRSIAIDLESWLRRDFCMLWDLSGDFCQGMLNILVYRIIF